MVEGYETAFEFFVANQQLAEPIEPTVGHLDDPAAGPFVRMAFEFLGFLAAPLHVRDVSVSQDGLQRRGSAVSGIRTQVFRTTLRRGRTFDLNGIEYRSQLRHIMAMRPGHDER